MTKEPRPTIITKLPPSIRFFLDITFRKEILEKWSPLNFNQFVSMYKVEVVGGFFGLIGSWVFVNWNWLSHPVRVAWVIDHDTHKILFKLTSNTKNFTREKAVDALKQLGYISNDFPIASTSVQVLSDKEMEISIGKQTKEQLEAFVEKRDILFSTSIKSTFYGTLFTIGIVNWIKSVMNFQ